MSETAAALRAWETFYLIVGTAAGALTGLQFVVLTLVSESGYIRTSGETLSAFSTPNVVHFCAALLVSAVVSAPWHGLGVPGIVLAICGVSGVVYSFLVLMRALRQRDYKPVLEDWTWHAIFPILAYASLIFAGIELSRGSDALYVVGGASLLLVFIGIHNAWDTVAYIAVARSRHRASRAIHPEAPKPDPAPTSPSKSETGSSSQS